MVNMTEQELKSWIETTKSTVLLAVRKNLPGHLAHTMDDVIQETYFRFYSSFSKVDPDPELAAGWLYVTARNEARKVIRTSRREESRLLRFTVNYKRETYSENHESQLEDIEGALSDIPEPFGTTMRLRLEGFNIDEIAKKLHIQPGTVKSRLSRGREMLSRIVMNEGLG